MINCKYTGVGHSDPRLLVLTSQMWIALHALSFSGGCVCVFVQADVRENCWTGRHLTWVFLVCVPMMVRAPPNVCVLAWDR